MLDVITADGEEFPVKRKLLRSCISLTHAVRDTEQASVHLVLVDTLVFDRHALIPAHGPAVRGCCAVSGEYGRALCRPEDVSSTVWQCSLMWI